jgi:hypothetical protein
MMLWVPLMERCEKSSEDLRLFYNKREIYYMDAVKISELGIVDNC